MLHANPKIQRSLEEEIDRLTDSVIPAKIFNLSYITMPTQRLDDDALKQLADILRINKSIQCVEIAAESEDCSYDWSDVGANYFGEAIKSHPTLAELTIHVDSFKHEKFYGFLQSLTGSAKITTLRISGVLQKLQFLDQLGRKLVYKPTLREIYIDNFDRGRSCDLPDNILYLALGLSFQKELQVLSLLLFNLNHNDIQLLEYYLKEIKTLKILKLQKCTLTSTQSILNIALKNPKLETLDISHNAFVPTEMSKLISQLPQLQLLTNLSLASTKLSPECLENLIKFYSQEKIKLTTLNISYNPCLNKAFNLIAPLIKGNKILKNLKIAHDDFSPESFTQIKIILSNPYHCQLEKLWLITTNKWRNHDFEDLEYCVKQNEFLTIAGPYDEPLSPESCFSTNVNKKPIREKQAFINFSICFAQMYLSKLDSTIDTAMLILSFLDPMPSKTLSTYLILENLTKRRSLIESKSYTASSNPDISQWWSQTIFHQNKIKRILTHNPTNTTGFFYPDEKTQQALDIKNQAYFKASAPSWCAIS